MTTTAASSPRCKTVLRLLALAKYRARVARLPFDLTYEDIVIPTVCPILGIPLEPSRGRRTANSPSLDRIIGERGYTRGNVLVVSWRANALKGNSTVDELLRIAAAYQQILT
jgi:hypothetical protein